MVDVRCVDLRHLRRIVERAAVAVVLRRPKGIVVAAGIVGLGAGPTAEIVIGRFVPGAAAIVVIGRRRRLAAGPGATSVAGRWSVVPTLAVLAPVTARALRIVRAGSIAAAVASLVRRIRGGAILALPGSTGRRRRRLRRGARHAGSRWRGVL